MVQPELSFCVTNYNCSHALERHLESVFSLFKDHHFEYIVMDNKSTDGSMDILRSFSEKRPNMKVSIKKATRGRARQLAFLKSKGKYIVIVDADTVYYPIASKFVEIYLEKYREYAVQSMYLGIFPRDVWQYVGGMGNFNVAEDFDLWMRIWKLGKMKWYPVQMGENVKEPRARDTYDHLSSRYGRFEKFTRFLRREFDSLRLRKYEKLDLVNIWKSNVLDFGLEEMEDTYFGERRSPPLKRLPKYFAKSIWQILREE